MIIRGCQELPSIFISSLTKNMTEHASSPPVSPRRRSPRRRMQDCLGGAHGAGAKQYDELLALLRAHPEDACEGDAVYGSSVLSWAVNDSAVPLEIVQRLVAAAPSALTRKDARGGLVLHYAAANRASPSVIALLLRTYPEAAAVLEDAHALLPLHLAAANRAPAAAVQLLIEANPHACCIGAVSRHGWLPLHFAIEYWQTPEVVAMILARYSEAARTVARIPGWAGVPPHTQLPLHRALYLGQSDLVSPLLEAFPEAIRQPDNLHGLMPLHIAIKLSLGAHVVRKLLDAWPEAAACAKDGLLPLHMACECSTKIGGSRSLHFHEKAKLGEARANGKSTSGDEDAGAPNNTINVDIVRVLLRANPSAVTTAGIMNGLLPLHMACAHRANLDVIKELVDAAPITITARAGRAAKSMHGMIPLHVTLACDVSVRTSTAYLERIVQFFLEANAECACIADTSGRLAVHHALCGGASEDIVRHILGAFPDGIKAPIGDHGEASGLGGMLPLHIASSIVSGRNYNVVKMLLDIWPEGAKEVDTTGRIPLQHAFHSFSSDGQGSRDVSGRGSLHRGGFEREDGSSPLTHPQTQGGREAVYRNTYDSGVVELLMNAYPRGTAMRDYSGCCSLHHAAWHLCDEDVEILGRVLESYPEAAQVVDDELGMLPLHYASLHGCSEMVVRALMHAYPEGVRKRTEADPDDYYESRGDEESEIDSDDPDEKAAAFYLEHRNDDYSGCDSARVNKGGVTNMPKSRNALGNKMSAAVAAVGGLKSSQSTPGLLRTRKGRSDLRKATGFGDGFGVGLQSKMSLRGGLSARTGANSRDLLKTPSILIVGQGVTSARRLDGMGRPHIDCMQSASSSEEESGDEALIQSMGSTGGSFECLSEGSERHSDNTVAGNTMMPSAAAAGVAVTGGGSSVPVSGVDVLTPPPPPPPSLKINSEIPSRQLSRDDSASNLLSNSSQSSIGRSSSGGTHSRRSSPRSSLMRNISGSAQGLASASLSSRRSSRASNSQSQGSFGRSRRSSMVRAVSRTTASSATSAASDGAGEAPGRLKLPLHLACGAEKPSIGVVRALLEAYPRGVHAVDGDGRRPLQIAVSNRAPLDIVMLLVEAGGVRIGVSTILDLHYHALERTERDATMDATRRR